MLGNLGSCYVLQLKYEPCNLGCYYPCTYIFRIRKLGIENRYEIMTTKQFVICFNCAVPLSSSYSV